MFSRFLVLVAALLMAPLDANAADLVVWWEKGYYPQEDEAVSGDCRRLRAGDWRAGRASLLSAGELPGKIAVGA